MRTVSERGMTLIELLIAVTLVSLISVGMVMAIRIAFNTQSKTNEHLYSNRRYVAVNNIIDSQINSIMAVTAECIGAGAPSGKVSFFQGEPQSMRFVSAYSLEEAHRGFPRILEFQVVPGELNQGVRLVVNEHYYNGPYSTGSFCTGMGTNPMVQGPVVQWLPIQTGRQSFVLADKLQFCRMVFLESLKEPPYQRWVPVWSKPYLPAAIRIEMQPLAQQGKQRLPLVTVTAPVRVTRDPLETYVDY